MKAIYDSDCVICKKKISIGEEIDNYEYEGKNTWAHTKCIDEKKSKDKKPEQKNTKSEKTIIPKDPFQEAELIVYWASDKAYKKALEGITDITKLTTQQINSIGQKEGMLTRTLVFTTLELMKINNIKSSYAVKKK